MFLLSDTEEFFFLVPEAILQTCFISVRKIRKIKLPNLRAVCGCFAVSASCEQRLWLLPPAVLLAKVEMELLLEQVELRAVPALLSLFKLL